MAGPVSLHHSKKLVNQLNLMIDDETLRAWSKQIDNVVAREEIVAWLMQKVTNDEQTLFLLESLRAALLQDLHNSFLDDDQLSKQDTTSTSWFEKAQFIYLAIAGTLLAICEGFDGIVSILGSFSAVPMGVIFLVGFTFSLLSVAVFYVFDLVEISKQIGVRWGKSGKMLDIFLEQVDQIEKLRKVIDDCYANESTDVNADAIERRELKQLVAMLAWRYSALDEARASYLRALNDSSALECAKLVVTALTAVVFFGGGFFAGQTLALAVASLFIASVSATFLPIIAVSSVVGLAALSLYYFIQRPVLANLVGHWLGLDEQEIHSFADAAVVHHHKRELDKLACKIVQLEMLHVQLAQLVNQDSTSNRARMPVTVRMAIDQPLNLEKAVESTTSAHCTDSSGFSRLNVVTTCRDTMFHHKRSRSLGDINEPIQVGGLRFA